MTPTHLLIVEDDDDIAQMLETYFRERGYEPHVALTGEEALRLARCLLPNLILLDVNLPDIDGYTLFKQFRAAMRLRYTPIIFLTMRSKREERRAGLQLGADDFINKPFDLEEVFLRVQNAIARAARENLTDPRTGLPGLAIVRQALALQPAGGDRRVIEFRIRNLAPFLDRYGMLAVADVIRYTALLLNGVLDEFGNKEDFLGQSGDESFTVICSASHAAHIRRAAVERFNADVAQHYSMAERTPDGVRLTTPAGQKEMMPVMRLEAVEAGR